MKSVLGRKIGMTQIFDEKGDVHTVTVVDCAQCIVLQRKTKAKDGYSAIQLGLGEVKKATKAKLGHAKKAGLEKAKKFVREIRIPENLDINAGTVITPDKIFTIGEKISVTGTTIGKGFTGPIKRWNFTLGPSSHGSKNHRVHGAMPVTDRGGRVPKGSKSSGHYGVDQVTITGLSIVDIISDKQVILVSGAIPGPKNGLVVVSNRKAEYDAGKLAIQEVKKE
jgi:large subunit ribosomal protein L3